MSWNPFKESKLARSHVRRGPGRVAEAIVAGPYTFAYDDETGQLLDAPSGVRLALAGGTWVIILPCAGVMHGTTWPHADWAAEHLARTFHPLPRKEAQPDGTPRR
jgi:hypothetical protein